ncbi:MAG: DUF1289 domain-containing protein [Rhizobiaceae bacterium]
MQSPCILVCSIDLTTGYCYGCGRTAEEIAGWIGYDDEQRAAISQGLNDRLSKIERKPRRETRRRKMARERNSGTTGNECP